MEKTSTNFIWEQDFKISIEAEKNKQKIVNSIEVPDLIFRDYLRMLKSKHVKIE